MIMFLSYAPRLEYHSTDIKLIVVYKKTKHNIYAEKHPLLELFLLNKCAALSSIYPICDKNT